MAIGRAYSDGGDFRALTKALLASLYGYDDFSPVLFKPTKASATPFRFDRESALSYFVGGGVTEDRGFALQPWSAVRFKNAGVFVDGDSATAMGEYFFTDARSGAETKVEYTFQYERARDNTLKIVTHHSSLPYKP